MKIHAVRCKQCGATIYSRAIHDFRSCPCKSIAVDGGFDYNKVCGNFEDFEFLTINVSKVTKKELYDDWNYHYDKYGVIIGDAIPASTKTTKKTTTKKATNNKPKKKAVVKRSRRKTS